MSCNFFGPSVDRVQTFQVDALLAKIPGSA